MSNDATPIRDWLFAVFVLFVALEGLSWEMASWPFPCVIEVHNSEKPPGNNDEKYCPTFHMGLMILAARTDHFIEAHDKSIVAGFTIVLAISTIGLWLATNRLWEAGERQLKLIERNAEVQTRDMRESIGAAKLSANAIVGAERARIIIAHVIIRDIALIRTTGAQIVYAILNTGRTLGTVSHVPLHIRTVDLRNQDQWPRTPDGYNQAKESVSTLIFPGADREPRVISPTGRIILSALTERDMALFLLGIGGILCYGAAEYSDIFGEHHTSGFAYVLTFDKDGQSACHPYIYEGFRRQT